MSSVASATPVVSGSLDFRDIVSNSNHTPRNLILVVTEFPDESAPQEEKEALRAFFEMHILAAEGFITGLVKDPIGSPYNPTKEIAVYYRERYGRVIENLLMKWMRKDGYGTGLTNMTLMAIEPDPTLTLPVAAWLIEMYPVSTGNIPAVRDVSVNPKAPANQLARFKVARSIYSTDEVLKKAKGWMDDTNSLR